MCAADREALRLEETHDTLEDRIVAAARQGQNRRQMSDETEIHARAPDIGTPQRAYDDDLLASSLPERADHAPEFANTDPAMRKPFDIRAGLPAQRGHENLNAPGFRCFTNRDRDGSSRGDNAQAGWERRTLRLNDWRGFRLHVAKPASRFALRWRRKAARCPASAKKGSHLLWAS